MDISTGFFELVDSLTNEIFQELFQISKSDVTFLKSISEALPKSYTCKLSRINVNYVRNSDKQLCSISFISKEKDNQITFATDLGMVSKEITMYQWGLPKLEAILGEKISPKTFIVTDGMIIMEDLNMDGYKNTKRGDLLDFKHCVCSVKALAKFHAASVVLCETDVSLVKSLGEELFYRDEYYEKFHVIIENGLQSLAEEVAKWPESEHYQQPILRLRERIWELLTSTTKQNDFMCVLNHGDFTLNNILFKYDRDGEVTHVKLIDFQCCRYCSPVIDLQSFLFTNVNVNVIKNNLGEILDVYLNTFNSILLKLGCSRHLSKSNFDFEFKKADFIGLYASSISLPQNIVDDKQSEELKAVNFEDFKDANTNPIFRLMKLQKYRDMMSEILKIFDDRGLFVE